MEKENKELKERIALLENENSTLKQAKIDDAKKDELTNLNDKLTFLENELKVLKDKPNTTIASNPNLTPPPAPLKELDEEEKEELKVLKEQLKEIDKTYWQTEEHKKSAIKEVNSQIEELLKVEKN